MKLKLVRITKIICFCMVAVLMVGGLTDLLKPKWLENRWVSAKTNKSFYELQDNSAEVVFFGASIISAAMASRTTVLMLSPENTTFSFMSKEPTKVLRIVSQAIVRADL